MSLTLINSQTASGDTTVSFTTGIDSTYKTYLFKCVKIHPSVDGYEFAFQANVDGASGYNETMTTTYFRTIHREDDTKENITDIPDWCASVVDEFLTKLEEENE